MRNTLLLAPLFLCCALQAQTTYFVDAVNGSDMNGGQTRANAFKSITTAATFLSDDDTLIVLPGTYSPSATGEQYPIQFGDTGKATTQHRLTIYGEGGPSVTIVDGEQQNTGAGTPIMRFRWEADGSTLSGFTFQNTGSSDFFSMCFRLGSTSGSNFATRNIEIYGNVFRDVHRAIVVFGTNPTSSIPNQTHGIMIHDNLVVDAAHRPFAIFGTGTNYVYNNTIINPGHDGIWADDIFSGASDTTIANNIIMGGSVHGIAVGSNGASATVVNNNAFGNSSGNYDGFTPSAGNTSVDPMFVGGGDYHLQAASAMRESGSTNLPTISHDLERFPRQHDSNGDRTAGIDKGCYQHSDYIMVMTGDWEPGKGVTFTFGAPTPGLGVVYFATASGAMTFNPFGVLLIDPATLLASAGTMAPGALVVPIPNDPNLLGFRLVMQGAYLTLALNDGHLLNVVDRTF